jgi:hypothetical protein
MIVGGSWLAAEGRPPRLRPRREEPALEAAGGPEAAAALERAPEPARAEAR